MVNGKSNYGFAIDRTRKDLVIILAEGDNNNSRLPVTVLADQFYTPVQTRGGQRRGAPSFITCWRTIGALPNVPIEILCGHPLGLGIEPEFDSSTIGVLEE